MSNPNRVLGGRKTAAKNLAKNPNYYRDIGRIGGQNGTTGGFACQAIGSDGLTGSERASRAGNRGGRISRRGKAK